MANQLLQFMKELFTEYFEVINVEGMIEFHSQHFGSPNKITDSGKDHQ